MRQATCMGWCGRNNTFTPASHVRYSHLLAPATCQAPSGCAGNHEHWAACLPLQKGKYAHDYILRDVLQE